MKCPPEEVSALAKLLLSPQERLLLRNSSDSTDTCESTCQTPSILGSDSVEKLMKRHVHFTDDEKMDIVEALADCTDKTKLQKGLLELHETMGDRKFATIDSKKVGRWRTWYNNTKQGKDGKKRGRQVNIEFESDVWSELILCALNTIKTPDGEEMQECQVLHNVAYSYAIIRKAAEDVKALEKWQKNVFLQ